MPLEQDLVPIAVGPVQGIRYHHCNYEPPIIAILHSLHDNDQHDQASACHHLPVPPKETGLVDTSSSASEQAPPIRYKHKILFSQTFVSKNLCLSVLNRLSSVRGPPLASSFLREGFVTSRGRFLWLGPFQKEVGGIWKHW